MKFSLPLVKLSFSVALLLISSSALFAQDAAMVRHFDAFMAKYSYLDQGKYVARPN